MTARLRQQQATSMRHRAVSAAFLASDRNGQHKNSVYRQIRSLDRGPVPRPKLCQWIAGEPTLDDSCKCRAPVMETEPDERQSPYCAEHEARAHGRKVAA